MAKSAVVNGTKSLKIWGCKRRCPKDLQVCALPEQYRRFPNCAVLTSACASSDFSGLMVGSFIPGTKMTNTGLFLLNESSKIEIFTDILYPFCQRLLRPADVTFLKTKNVHISKILNLRISKLLSNKILLAYFYMSEPIHNVQFNVRYPKDSYSYCSCPIGYPVSST